MQLPLPGSSSPASVVGDDYDPERPTTPPPCASPSTPRSISACSSPPPRSVASRASRSRSPPRSGIPGPRRQTASPSSSRSVPRPGSSRRPEPALRNYCGDTCSPISAHYLPRERHLDLHLLAPVGRAAELHRERFGRPVRSRPGRQRSALTVQVAEPPGRSPSPHRSSPSPRPQATRTSRWSGPSARRPVTVHYQTSGGNATPGVDYQPVSGVLTFAERRDDPDDPWCPCSPTRTTITTSRGAGNRFPHPGASLGHDQSRSGQIHDTDPDVTPPVVSGPVRTGSASSITSFVMTFSEPILFSPAASASDFQIFDLGTSGSPGAAGGRGWQSALSPRTTRRRTRDARSGPAAAGRALVSGVRPAAGGHPFATRPVTCSREPGPGQAGTDYVGLFGRGTTLKYYDRNSDLVTLKVTGGGYLDEVRDPSGEGQVLRVQGAVYHKTALSGSVVRSMGRGNGTNLAGDHRGPGPVRRRPRQADEPPLHRPPVPVLPGPGPGRSVPGPSLPTEQTQSLCSAH